MPGEDRFSQLEKKSFDMLIVGAGINGAMPLTRIFRKKSIVDMLNC